MRTATSCTHASRHDDRYANATRGCNVDATHDPGLDIQRLVGETHTSWHRIRIGGADSMQQSFVEFGL